MSQVREQTRLWITTRVCLGCGYGGPELQRRNEAAVFTCPCCSDDLYARPPRSYAEMEGLLPACTPPRARSAPPVGRAPAGRAAPRPTLLRRLLVRLHWSGRTWSGRT